MTWAVEHPNQRRWSRSSATSDRSGIHVSVRPVGAAEVGLLAALVGAWGALSVFVGPEFGYRPTAAGSWAWTTQNWLLHLLPGAVAVVAGLMILSASPSRRHEGTGAPIGLAALMIVAAGSWFVIGPTAWATFQSGQPFATGTSAWTSFLNQVGTSLGPGLLLAVLGGMALKAVIARPAATVHDVPVDDRGPVAASGLVPGTGPAAATRLDEDDEMTGQRMPDEGMTGQGMAQPGMTNQGMAGDRMAGDRMAGDRMAGDRTAAMDPMTDEEMAGDRTAAMDPMTDVEGGPGATSAR